MFDSEKPVYIIGGGASLKGFQWSLLEGKQTIAVNTAFRKASFSSVLFFTDSRFYTQWKDVDPASDFWRFKGSIFSTLDKLQEHPRINHIAFKALTKGTKIKLESMNTGAAAILLAKELGAKTVVLLGFDGGGSHWHEGTALSHSSGTSAEAYEVYLKEFDAIAKAKTGLEIINANELSLIQSFDTMPLTNALTI